MKRGENENRRLRVENYSELSTEGNNRSYLFKILLIVLSAILFSICIYIATGIWNKYGKEFEPIIPVNMMDFNHTLSEDKYSFPSETYVNEDKITGVMEYGSPTMKIIIEPVVRDELRMWISTIMIKEPKQLKSAFAGDEFNLINRERTSDMARRYEAIFAINGAATGFNERSFVIRDGIIYRDTSLDCAPLIIKDNGDFQIFNHGEKSGQEILEMGGRHTYDFGPDLIKNYEIVDYGDGWYKEGKEPRTAIGQSGPLEYMVIVADGRSSKSKGISFYDLALEFKQRGCQWAYALDGGGSTTLYFNGQVLNEPSDWNGERKVSDILFFTN